jgi:hypothetical protein
VRDIIVQQTSGLQRGQIRRGGEEMGKLKPLRGEGFRCGEPI